MFVAASTGCFPDFPLTDALERLADLEYTNVEIVAHESGGHMKPSAIAADLDGAIRICRQPHRLTTVAYASTSRPPASILRAIRRLLQARPKATKVVALTVRSAELGTPFNAEVERLRRLVSIAASESVLCRGC